MWRYQHDYYTPDALHPLDPYALAVVQHMELDARQDYRREEEASVSQLTTSTALGRITRIDGDFIQLESGSMHSG